MMNKMFAKRSFSSAILKEKMAGIIASRQQETLAFKKANASAVIGEVTIGQVMGGMRGLPGMHYETSKLDAMDGIAYRGQSLWEVQKKGPKTIPGGEPIPEGVLWLFLPASSPPSLRSRTLRRRSTDVVPSPTSRKILLRLSPRICTP